MMVLDHSQIIKSVVEDWWTQELLGLFDWLKGLRKQAKC
jgi:hypothetical protein